MAPLGTAEFTNSQLSAAWQLQIYTRTGEEITFGSLFAADRQGVQHSLNQVLVIFIRHFFCGNCQEYVRHLAEVLPPSRLPSTLKVAIIGCGAPTLIDSYRTVTRCPDEWQVYANPTTNLYDLLGMHRSLSLGSKSPAYIQHSLALGMLKSALQGMKRLGHGDVRAAGDWSVQGGEFLFESTTQPEHGWKLSWCHRMRNSRDHTESTQLVKCLGLDGTHSTPVKSSHVSTTMEDNVITGLDAQSVRSSSLRRSFSLRRDRIVAKAGRFTRTTSFRRSATVQVS